MPKKNEEKKNENVEEKKELVKAEEGNESEIPEGWNPIEIPTITLNDENGNPVTFQFLDEELYEDDYYLIVTPLDPNLGEEDAGVVYIFKEEEDENSTETVYTSVDDTKLAEIIYGIFKEKFKENFDFMEDEKAKKEKKK